MNSLFSSSILGLGNIPLTPIPGVSILKSWLKATLVFCFASLIILANPFADSALATGVYDLDPIHAGDSTWVVDQADVLSRFNEGQLKGRLEQIQEKTGTEVRFIIFRRLDYGETIESFTDGVFQAWFPEEESAQNQVLIALDTQTNTVAAQYGSATQALLTQEIATSVTDETMMAPIRDGDRYSQSLLDASDRLALVLAGEEDPGPPIVEDKLRVEGNFASSEETKESNATTIVIILLIVATVVPMLTYFAYVR